MINAVITIGIVLGMTWLISLNQSDTLVAQTSDMEPQDSLHAETAPVRENIAVVMDHTSKPATQPAVVAKSKVYTTKISEAELIDDFSITSGQSVNSGFVFLDGKYIDAPYVVARKGLSVDINGYVIYRVLLPEKEPPSGDSDPTLPPEINKNTSQYDEIYSDYIRQKIAYVQKHHTREEEQRIMERVYRSLPFIKEAKLSSDGRYLSR